MPRSLPLLLMVLWLTSCGPTVPGHMDANGNQSTAAATEKNSARPCHIVFVDVGQGDATLIVGTDGQALLIDAGPTEGGGEAVMKSLTQEGITELTAIIATHYHADHIGGIPTVVAGNDGQHGTADDIIPVEGFFDRGETHEPPTPAYHNYQTTAQGRRHALSPGDQFSLGDARVEAVAAAGRLADGRQIALDPFDENSASIATLISCYHTRLLIAADLTGGGGTPPYDTLDLETSLAPLVGNIDILRVAHHGSHTSTNQALLDATHPAAAIISVGDGNDYFHPHPAVIDRLIQSGAAVYQTEQGWTDNQDVHVAHGDITLHINPEDYELALP